jgi:hypothetical protein
MKVKKLLSLLILLPLSCVCQDTSKTQTKFEEFSSEDGILRKFEIKKIGKVKSFTMSKKTVTNVETGKFYNAIEITEKPGFWGLNMPGLILLDEDELPSLMKTFKYFQTNVVTDQCKENCPSFQYETKGGVKAHIYKEIGAYGSAWHIYLGKNLAMLDLDTKDLDNLIRLLESYK